AIQEWWGRSPNSAPRYSRARALLLPMRRSASRVPWSAAASSRLARTSRRLAMREWRGRAESCLSQAPTRRSRAIPSNVLRLLGISGTFLRVGKRTGQDGLDAGDVPRPGLAGGVQRLAPGGGEPVVLARRAAGGGHQPGGQAPLPLQARQRGIDRAFQHVRE